MTNPAKIFNYSKGVEQKRKELFDMAEQLKKEFVGIDNVIDRTVKIMEPWMIIPDAQNRPTINCLWGMTGTGKTSLVRRIADLLNIPLIQIDLGEYSENKSFSIDFYEKYSDFSGKPCIILLDEIQNCSTVGRMGEDIERQSLRGLWSLLSDGKIIPDKRIHKDWCQEEIEERIHIFKKHNSGANVENKIANHDPVIDKEEIIKTIKKIYKKSSKAMKLEEVIINDDDDEDVYENDPWSISPYTVSYIIKMCKIDKNKMEILEMLDKDFLNTAHFLLEQLEKIEVQPQLNYQKSMIFIAGNLDEIYLMSKNANPDITCDELYERSKKITVPDIKASLIKRFKPEQVARLGNNHVIYRAFSEQNFRDIIKLDLIRIKNNILREYYIDIYFDKSVEDLIYKEGVFPTQGARPVLSTISNIVEGSIPSCFKEIISRYENNPLNAPIKIKMEMDSNKAIAIFTLNDSEHLNDEKLFLSIEDLRKPIYDDEHCIIAIHEAGHTICQIIATGELPLKVCAFSPNTRSKGYMERKDMSFFSKEDMLSQITVLLGGYAAEKIIFGDNKVTGGSHSDLAIASSEACSAIQEFGFGELPIVSQRMAVTEDLGILYGENIEKQIKEIISSCLKTAEQYISQHKKILLDISSELINSPSLSCDDIMKILDRNNFTLKTKDKITSIFENEMKKNNIDFKAKY